MKFPAADATNLTLQISVKLADEMPVFVMADGFPCLKSDDFSSGTADVTITLLHVIGVTPGHNSELETTAKKSVVAVVMPPLKSLMCGSRVFDEWDSIDGL